MSNALKVNWQDEELDVYYRKNGHPKSVWQDNEGKPFGIYYYESMKDDPWHIDCRWFKTIEERDEEFEAAKNE